MKEHYVQLILARLERDADSIKADFETPKGVPTKFAAIDDLLPEEDAKPNRSSFSCVG